MKKLYIKFPLVLLTLLNYAPYTYTTKKKTNTVKSTNNSTNKKTTKKKSKSIKRADDTVINQAAEQSATNVITDFANEKTDVQALINNFMNAEVPESFDVLFESSFSKDILKNNEEEIYSFFSQRPLSPAIQTREIPFELEEFENAVTAILTLRENSVVEITSADEKYTTTVPLAFFAELGCNKIFKATINAEHNILFLHFGNDQAPDLSFIGLINTKTLVSMVIPCASEKEIKTIGICSDCIHLGIIRTEDDALLSYDLPNAIVDFAPSLKQRAFITYIDAQINMLGQKIMQNKFSNDIIKTYSRLPLDTVYKLALFIHTNKDLLPESLHHAICNEKINSLQQILTVSANAKFVAETLNIDIDTLADKMASNEITQEQVLAILAPDQSSVDNQTLNA